MALTQDQANSLEFLTPTMVDPAADIWRLDVDYYDADEDGGASLARELGLKITVLEPVGPTGHPVVRAEGTFHATMDFIVIMSPDSRAEQTIRSISREDLINAPQGS